MIVVDASALVEFLLQSSAAGAVEQALEGHDLFAPELLDAEALSALTGYHKRGILSDTDVERALSDLLDAPLTRVPHAPLVWAAWQRSAALSAYDALYVALAAELGCALVTADRRLTRAQDLGIPLTLIGG